jgi:hypothetical protein
MKQLKKEQEFYVAQQQQAKAAEKAAKDNDVEQQSYPTSRRPHNQKEE